MSERQAVLMPPHRLALMCAVFAVALGAAALILSGAPWLYALVNAGSLFLAGLLLGIGAALGRWLRLRADVIALIAGLLLLVISPFGQTAEDATRWISVGGMTLQPSLMLLPVLVVSFAKAQRVLSLLGIAAAAVALAWQPDRAMAGALLLALLPVSAVAKDRVSIAASLVALAGLLAAITQPDTVAPVKFVERVLNDALAAPGLDGALAWLSVALLIVPGTCLMSRAHRQDAALLSFCGLWLGVIIAAILGNYPTPFAGYGASSVIGYVLGAGALRRIEDVR